jgi:hypothetical protein
MTVETASNRTSSSDVPSGSGPTVCPVCETQNSDERTHCVQCRTDLRPLVRANRLPLELLAQGLAMAGANEDGGDGVALEHLAAAALLQPGSAAARVALANSYLSRNLHDLAVPHCEASVALEPDATEVVGLRRRLEAAREQSAAGASRALRMAQRSRRLAWLLPALGFAAGLGLGLTPWRPSPDLPPKAVATPPPSPPTRPAAAAAPGPSPPAASAQGTPAPPTTRREATVHYRVHSGDSLWLIAKHKYGVGSLWPLIAQANHLDLASRKVRVGDDLVLPVLTLAPH